MTSVWRVSRLKKCNLCQSEEHRSLGYGANFAFIECLKCGLQWSSPIPSEEELSRFYENFFAGHRVRDEFPQYVQLAERSLNHQFGVVQSIAPSLNYPGRFLDVGCGGGHYVCAAGRFGWEAYGIEVDASAVRKAVEMGLKNIYNCYPRESPFCPGFFDVIKAMHVLEHCTDPTGFLQDLARLLRARGVLIIDVPNQASIIAKFKVILSRLGLRDDYGYLQPPLHLYAFTPRTLELILEKSGFKVRRIVWTSPVDQLYFPTTESYYSSLRWRLVELLYKTSGAGSYMSIYATKDAQDPGE